MWPSVKKKKKNKEGGYRQDDEKERPTALRWQQSKGNATDNTLGSGKMEIVLRRPETTLLLASPLCREFEPDGGEREETSFEMLR